MRRLVGCLFPLLVTACSGCDVQSFVKGVDQVAKQASEAVQQAGDAVQHVAPVADTHEALYDAMLGCEESFQDIVEGLGDVQAAGNAEPRLTALAGRFRDYSQRYLLLDLPDKEESQRLVETFADRERKLAERAQQSAQRLAGNRELLVAVLNAGSGFGQARERFQNRRDALRNEKALSKSGDDPLPDISQHEAALVAAAGSLNMLAVALAEWARQPSGSQRQQAVQTQAAEFQQHVDVFLKLPAVRQTRLVIRLDPAQDKVKESLERYKAAQAAAKTTGLDLQFVIKLEDQVARAMQKITASPVARELRERMESRLAAAPAPSPAPGGDFPRPGPPAGFPAKRPGEEVRGRYATNQLPAALEGEDVVVIAVTDIPSGAGNRVTERLKALCNTKVYQARTSNGRYEFRAQPISDIQQLAAKIDFGTVVEIDTAARTITLKIDADKL